MNPVKRLRFALILVLIGLIVELVSQLVLSPLTFLAFVGIGVPCMALGVFLYVVHVLRELKKKDAL